MKYLSYISLHTFLLTANNCKLKRFKERLYSNLFTIQIKIQARLNSFRLPNRELKLLFKKPSYFHSELWSGKFHLNKVYLYEIFLTTNLNETHNMKFSWTLILTDSEWKCRSGQPNRDFFKTAIFMICKCYNDMSCHCSIYIS